MKVRNIMFSGFAAAILMGTVSANAAGSFEIASKAYVDSKVVTGLTDTNGDPISVAEALGTKADAETVGDVDDLSDFDSNPGTIVDALNELEGDVTAVEGQVDALEGVVGFYDPDTGDGMGLAKDVADNAAAIATKANATDLTALTNRVSTAEGEIDGLQNQVGNVAMGTTAGTVTGAIKELNDSISSLTGGAGSVANQISDAIGNIGTHDNGQGQQVSNTVAEALADKQDKADSTVAANQVTAANHLTAGAGVAGNLVALGNALGTVEGVVGDASSGLVQQVNSLNSQLNDTTSGLAATVAQNTSDISSLSSNKADASSLTSHTSDTTIHLTSDEKSAIANLLATGYANCISTANGSGHCVLTADSNGLSWTLVTSPWVD